MGKPCVLVDVSPTVRQSKCIVTKCDKPWIVVVAAFIALALLFDVSGAVLHDDLYSSAVVLFYCGQLSVSSVAAAVAVSVVVSAVVVVYDVVCCLLWL